MLRHRYFARGPAAQGLGITHVGAAERRPSLDLIASPYGWDSK